MYNLMYINYYAEIYMYVSMYVCMYVYDYLYIGSGKHSYMYIIYEGKNLEKKILMIKLF